MKAFFRFFLLLVICAVPSVGLAQDNDPSEAVKVKIKLGRLNQTQTVRFKFPSREIVGEVRIKTSEGLGLITTTVASSVNLPSRKALEASLTVPKGRKVDEISFVGKVKGDNVSVTVRNLSSHNLVKGELIFLLKEDNDNDGAPRSIVLQSGRGNIEIITDCDDEDPFVRPTQDDFVFVRPTLGWDVNCDGTEELQISDLGIPGKIEGWLGRVPECGDIGERVVKLILPDGTILWFNARAKQGCR